jgi:phosphoserine phosphatase
MSRSKHALKAAFLDVDGTLKQERDPYIYLHRQLGTLEQARPHEEMVRRGEIDIDQWGQLDARLWAGHSADTVVAAFRRVPWMPGARSLVERMWRAGVRLVLVSSGIDLHVDGVADAIQASHAFCNRLVVEDGRLTGDLVIDVPEEGKGDVVRQVMADLRTAPEACIALGDGMADVEMFRAVGWSAAIDPLKASIGSEATITLDQPDLSPLIRLLVQVFDV